MFLDTYRNLVKYLQRVSLDVSICWRYLYQDVGKTYLEIEITKMRSYWKYSKATICKYMRKKIGDLVVIEELRRRQIFSKKNLRQTKCLQEEMGKFFCKIRLVVKADIPHPLVRREFVEFCERLT